MENVVIAQEELAIDGVCFFCGNYDEMIADHETRVHGHNRSRNNEVY